MAVRALNHVSTKMAPIPLKVEKDVVFEETVEYTDVDAASNGLIGKKEVTAKETISAMAEGAKGQNEDYADTLSEDANSALNCAHSSVRMVARGAYCR